MPSIYLINSPFQLLTAYIIANSYDPQPQKYLLLVNPQGGYQSWQNTIFLQMILTNKIWDKTFSFERKRFNESLKTKSFKTIIRDLKSDLFGSGKINQIYLGSDKNITNQLIVDWLGQSSFIRIDEGIGSYLPHVKKRTSSKLWRMLSVQTIRLIGGFRTSLKYNFDSLGASLAATTDYLYKPELLKRPSPCPLPIEQNVIQHALKELAPPIQKYEELESEKIMLFLGATHAAINIISLEQEILLLRLLSQYALQLGCVLIYKPHPGEDKTNYETLPDHVQSLKVFNCYEPIESIIYRYHNIKYIFSFASSGLLYLNLFATSDVKRICMFKINGADNQFLENFFKAWGVLVPNNQADLENILLA